MPLSSDSRVYVAGDSRSAPGSGIGTPWPTILQTASSFIAAPVAAGNFYNQAHGGYMTDDVINQFADGLYPINGNRPSLFFCWVGVNDFIQKAHTPAESYVNLQVIWKFARQRYYKVWAFLTGTQPQYFREIAELDRLILSDTSLYDNLVAPDGIIPVVPWNDPDHLWYHDDTHQNEASNQRIAQTISIMLGM